MISSLLESPEIASNLYNNLVRRNSDNSETLRDICDGSMYKSLNISAFDFTCSFNTDGVSPFRSSNSSIWPLLASINELSYSIRRSNTFLIGLWFGTKKPDFETFLHPFIEMFNELSHNPLQWGYNGNKVSSLCYFPVFIADSVARCVVQGLTQFNGKYGCPWCLNKGETYWIDKERRRRKWVYKYKECILRTQENYLENLNCLCEKLQTPDFNQDGYMGIKSASQLLLITKFHIINGCVYDIMHSAYLGVVKMLTSLWFDACNHEKFWYIGKKIDQIDSVLKMCKVPYDYDRTVRSILQRNLWKATEWRTWVFIASTVLQGILPEVYRLHLLKLSNSLMLLSDENITQIDLSYCEDALSSFVKQTENLYGTEYCTFNLHILLHATTCVQNWGPLWSYSAFQFENYNGILNNLFNGSNHVVEQIKSRTLELMEIQRRGKQMFKNTIAQDFFRSMMWSKTFAKQSRKTSDDINFLGPFKKYSFSVEEQRKLHDLFGMLIAFGDSFRRCVVHGKVYSRSDQATAKRNNSVISTNDGKMWLIHKLIYIGLSGGKAVAIASRIRSQPSIVNSYLTVVSQIDDAWSFVNLNSICRQKFILVEVADNKFKYLIRIPNVVELE
ncbi:unnamed protein product [Allacma fusca]|uniref:Transposase n=1 Tax=Allacma fusca TaxID=39272 RepID=A0A8J2J9B1_9HEXA|nr:unnamed protein product [Allacma fusca]